MKAGFYPRLALAGIRKNRRLYLPYLLTCTGMVMMFYIVHYLASMPTLQHMSGGSSTAMVLGFGTWIVALFALIFLFYTNSFLIRRRQKEFGLYNILGMGKRNLGRLLLWETVILLTVSLAAGLAGGILLSKMAELCLMAVIDGEVVYTLSIQPKTVRDTVVIFAVIFGLIFLKGRIQLCRLSAVSLLKSENVGEKPPRANILLGAAGLLLLMGAYAIALSIESPLIALAWFFVAVAMVVVATYLLFISGSVLLCRLLQKNKRYYYRKSHFISVSSMVYRMKRNGAGLASICILSTMVLVMMMGSGSLYFGKEASLRARYPHDITVTADYLPRSETVGYSDDKAKRLTALLESVLQQQGTAATHTEQLLCAEADGLLRDGQLTLNPQRVNAADTESFRYLTHLYWIPLESYNHSMGTREVLEEDEVLIYCVRRTYDTPFIETENGTRWRIRKTVDSMMASGDAAADIIPSVFIVTADINRAIDALNESIGRSGEDSLFRLRLCCSLDLPLGAEEQQALCRTIREQVRELDLSGEGGFYSCSVESREEERADFYGSFGGLFFLGILLSAVFLLATVLMIYYKQISEGYEDEARFAIMRKIGMTDRDIRKSINSQMLTVFFLPLVTAALHVAFAFPIVQKLLALFSLRDTGLSLAVTAAAFFVFGAFYVIVYRVTSNAYYAIVRSDKA